MLHPVDAVITRVNPSGDGELVGEVHRIPSQSVEGPTVVEPGLAKSAVVRLGIAAVFSGAEIVLPAEKPLPGFDGLVASVAVERQVVGDRMIVDTVGEWDLDGRSPPRVCSARRSIVAGATSQLARLACLGE